MITLIVHILIAAIIVGLLLWILSQIPTFAPFAHIVRIVIIVLFAIWLIWQLLPLLGGHYG
jgi:hypothetical protein